jgi:tRNA (mo5U34)-methyltransferase
MGLRTMLGLKRPYSERLGEGSAPATPPEAPQPKAALIAPLTPLVWQPRHLDEFAFIQGGLKESAENVQREIVRLQPWTYHVDTGQASTLGLGTYNSGTITFHRFRAGLIAQTVAKMLGDQLSNTSILDLGCNCGFFTLEMAALGAKRALGLDFRKENLDQAEMLKWAFGVERADFQSANVKDMASEGESFDVVLNLGLMYHLTTPYEVLKSCFDLTRKFCVVDTLTHKENFSGYHIRMANIASPIEGDVSFELQPTYRGIIDTMKAVGFKEIVEIAAPADGVELYGGGDRRCFIGFKGPSAEFLSRLN